MDADDIAETLSRNEKAILVAINGSPVSISELSSRLNIREEALVSASKRLLDLGLANVTNSVRVNYVLTALGRTYADSDLPEYSLANLILKGASMGDAKQRFDDDEYKAAIGILKRTGILKESSGKYEIDKDKLSELREKNELLHTVSDGKDVSTSPIISELSKRKIIERVDEVDHVAEITNQGKSVVRAVNFLKETVDKLGAETIKNWKDKAFRKYTFDSKLPFRYYGRKHITRQYIDLIKNVLVSMGFNEMQSNYVESSFWNFDVMMFRQEHPDRDIQDTVYVNGGSPKLPNELFGKVKKVYQSGFKSGKDDTSIGYRTDFDDAKSKVLILRGHTTATTFRYIFEKISKNKDAPAKYFSVSRVFRNEVSDATHLPEFYQIEGIVYDSGLTLRDLIAYIREFYSKLGMPSIRLKPTYNPYTEPSLEIQAYSQKLGRWLEVGNSGIFRQETLAPFGLAGKNILGWGFGMERMLALRLGLTDIRSVYGAFADMELLRGVESYKVWGKFE